MASSALRPAAGRVCIVMACTGMSEADQIERLLLDFDSGCLITYRRAEDMMLNAPSGKVVLVILATRDDPADMCRLLKWLRHCWNGSAVAVVGDEGGGREEMTAREGGALFLTRPVAPRHWSDLLSHVLKQQPTELAPKTDADARIVIHPPDTDNRTST